MRNIWPRALAQARFRSPLLILDEAHHLKNPATRLASLFVEPEIKEESDMLAGALSGGFERMLFMTATPFQLGHHELLHILERFDGIAWNTLPAMTRDSFNERLRALTTALDAAQRATTELDQQWRTIRWDDIPGGGPEGVDDWWQALTGSGAHPERILIVRRAYNRALEGMRAAEQLLQPWVIRHLRSRFLAAGIPRRRRLDGLALKSDQDGEREGIPIAEDAVLPFLLAARSQAMVARSQRAGGTARATFAEGLASSYEAFLETRNKDAQEEPGVEEEAEGQFDEDVRLARYLQRLYEALPSGESLGRHPKVLPLVERVTVLWERGEKVVVFCHYLATGRALVRHISAALDRCMYATVSRSVGCSNAEARDRVRRAGDAFDQGRPLERALAEFLEPVLADHPTLAGDLASRVHEVVRRFVRTPPFLTRYLNLGRTDRADAFHAALDTTDGSGLTLRRKLEDFVAFIADRCQDNEREEYLEALEGITPGARGEPPRDTSDLDEVRGGIRLPNVRLANGPVRQDTRRRLLLGFNSPFFPEVLVASSVMAEGVDLHLNCRYVIHHDLSWNPSTVEQRTGRVDRIGAKAERAGEPIFVYWPYVAGTQDEKMFRVVRDRERWFQVVMGEHYMTDELSTDRLADRVPLPEEAAMALAFRLEVHGRKREGVPTAET